MATNGATERQFQERIARAQEAARLASIAALARSASSDTPSSVPCGLVAPPPPRPPPPPPVGFRGPPRGPPPPLSRPTVLVPRGPARPVDAAAIPDPIRHRIDRLVEFIARNGLAFEETARARERDNPDFAFLHDGAPFHDYFVWKKALAAAPTSHALPPRRAGLLPVPPRPLATATIDPVLHVSVGALANACKTARAQGLPAYSPLPPDLLVSGNSVVPPIEPARLEARLAEFYRSSLPS